MTDRRLTDHELLCDLQDLAFKMDTIEAELRERHLDAFHDRAIEDGCSLTEADQAVTKTFGNTIRSIRTYKRELAGGAAWLGTILSNVIIDLFRERQRMPSKRLEGESPEQPVKKFNEEMTEKRSFQFIQCTVIAVESVSPDERDVLRTGPPGAGPAGKTREAARESYRSAFRSCYGDAEAFGE